MSKKLWLTLTFCGMALLGRAYAQEVTLTVHHFLGPKASTHAGFIEPWARMIEKDSEGRIKVEIFPSMSMGGKPPELYNQVRDGAADIVWTLGGYTPGVFPRVEVFELPTVHRGSALATTLAIQDSFELLAADFEAVHVLLAHVHAGQVLHMRNKRVSTPEDLAGLKIRTPSRTGAWVIQSWSAEPVGMPVPDVPQAISKGAIDGALLPFEILPPLKLQELTDYSILGEDGSRFGTAVFLFLMNKDRYQTLPDDLKAVIDRNSGAAIAEMAGTLWDEIEKSGMDMQTASGGEIVAIDADSMAAFDALSSQIEERWIEETSSLGIDGNALVKSARASVDRHSR